uniref:Uncharacterized protein n=1 Tax=Anguilla anguilla TaxID=7936 RepID=A0A0E9UKR3_ANGAN
MSSGLTWVHSASVQPIGSVTSQSYSSLL